MENAICNKCKNTIDDVKKLNLISFDNNLKFFLYCEDCGLKFSRINANHPKFITDKWEEVYNLFDSGRIK